MIDLEHKMIRQQDKVEPILDWRVVFQTPVGWFEKLDDACLACSELDLDPTLCVVPVAMAISETLHELR